MNQTQLSIMSSRQQKEHYHSCNKLLKAFTDVSKKYHSGITDPYSDAQEARDQQIEDQKLNSASIQREISKRTGLKGVNDIEKEFTQITY